MENTNITPAAKIPFDQAIADCQEKIAEAMKILATNSAAMQFIELLDIRPVNNDDVQMRLNTRNGGSTVLLEYNPYWVLRITDPSILAFFFYSEIIRIALHHCTDRRALPAQSQYLASNLLCFEDQSILHKWKDDVKEIINELPSAAQIEPILKPFGFNKSSDWFLEKLKAYIEKAISQQQQQNGDSGQNGKSGQGQGQGQGQGNSSGNGQGSSNGQGQGQSNGNGQGNDNSQSNSQGGGNGDDEKDDGNGNNGADGDDGENTDDIRNQGKNKNKNQNDCAKAVDEYFDSSEKHARSQTENWGENTMVDESVRHITEHMGANPELWGNMPGAMQEMIKARNKKKFDPTLIVRHFKQTIKDVAREQNRCKVNRRHPDMAGKIHKMKCSMAFCTDVSGSMSDRDVAMGQAFMTNFIKHVDLYYADWDCGCSEFRRIKKDPLRNGGGMEISGRGGTNPQCIIERLERDKLKLGGIVVFTDCGFDWPQPATKWVKRIFIIGTDDCIQPPSWCRNFLKISDIRAWYEANS